jgi:GT2 family glycosyltransferase
MCDTDRRACPELGSPVNPRVSIILVNWNSGFDTLECARSCLALEGPAFEITIVDNHSSDDSWKTLTEALGANPRVSLLRASQNRGFAGGNNWGITRALKNGADFVWLLNNDTIVNPTTLSALVDAASAHPRAGILGSKIHFWSQPDTLWFAGGSVQDHGHHYSRHRGVGEIDRGQYDQVEEVEYITGCSMLVRAAILRHIHLLSEDYFLYWEDVDWCARARQAGWACLYVPQSTLLHKVGASTDRQPEIKLRYETRNRLSYQWHFNRPGASQAVLALLLEFMAYCLRGDPQAFRGQMAGLLDFLLGRKGRIDA